MRIKPVQLNYKNNFIDDYRNQSNELRNYFEYNPFGSFTDRLKYINQRQYNREQLVDVLTEMNDQWGSDTATNINIARLRREDSVTVIGGQQAGLLTGPMYSINKVISIIQLAHAEEKKLGVPVIPVFWIAGEDHDFAEINHVYLEAKQNMKKYTINHNLKYKQSVSHIKLDKDETTSWLNDLFKEIQETIHTKFLYAELIDILTKSNSYVDFFALLINRIFSNTGLVLVDSGNELLREMESEYFISLINNQAAIAESVYSSVKQLQEKNYSISLDAEITDGHLFYHDDNNERVLLSRDLNGDWINKKHNLTLTTKQLIKIARQHPDKLSNNVVTRPLMQEWLFPTLAFVGGYGEISYWASLKSAFKLVELEMPPVVPRLSFTYITNSIEHLSDKRSIDIIQAIDEGVQTLKLNWLSNQGNAPIEIIVDEINSTIEKLHAPLRKIAFELGDDLGKLSETNLKQLTTKTKFLEKRLLNSVENKLKLKIEEYDKLDNHLNPENGLQERIWNPLPFINECGITFIKNLTELNLSLKEGHFIVYL